MRIQKKRGKKKNTPKTGLKLILVKFFERIKTWNLYRNFHNSDKNKCLDNPTKQTNKKKLITKKAYDYYRKS